MTWEPQLWLDLPVRDSDLPRMWQEEGKSYPYVIDVFDYACREKAQDELMVYTNADICVCSDCAIRVAEAMQDTDACYSMRRDLHYEFRSPLPDPIISQSVAYAGSDFYAFRVRWWTKNRKQFPDMLIACELWDAVLRQLIADTNPRHRVNVSNLSYHQKHASVWENSANRYRLQCQLHNLQVGCLWLRKHGVDPAVHGVPRTIKGINA